MITFLISCVLAWLIGYQIYNNDFLLLLGRYNYRIRIPQMISGLSLIGFFLVCFYDVKGSLVFVALGLITAFFTEYALSRMTIKSASNVIIYRLVVVIFVALGLQYYSFYTMLPLFIMGWYVRNCKYGVPYRNVLVLAKYLKYRDNHYTNHETVEVEIPKEMPDFSHAGNHQKNNTALPTYYVTEYGIFPNTKEDQIDKLQSLIDEVGSKGGGIIHFSRGKYYFNKVGKKQFLQINHSNIVLEGELDSENDLATELINCGSTVQGSRNPWLSPFFITTGEQVQKSNIFWGLQFRKRKKMVMRSGSMTDPGSDGTILTPDFATKIIKTSRKGEDLLHVEDASKVDNYILLGMYNTDKEASLLKDILGQDTIRPEWQAASRAGEEEAPSFQWLVEVKEVIDDHTIRLVQPLWRDCDMCFEPAVFNVPMLENITIRNLKLSSTWNGMFRHHGHKRYYSVAQAQEMDYGWNGINMKRVAHGKIENVVFKNFTNPLYVMDSRNVSCEHLVFKGHDGHQGIKIYEHACDNLFRDIVFYNHYADMMGGEGNAYGNVFSEVKYLNPCFKPVDYDFHGFSEGPMSPPSYNLFENIYGFAYIGSCGSLHMAPSCGRTNVWWNCYCEGEKRGSYLFHQKYSPNPPVSKKVLLKAIINAFKKACSTKSLSYKEMRNCFDAEKEKSIANKRMTYSEIARFYTDFYLYGLNTTTRMELLDRKYIHVVASNKTCSINSLYDYQRSHSSK